MARARIAGFEHQPGVHCGSTAFADAARFIGLPWSEPMVFGLGAGLAFYLIEADGMRPSRLFAGRSGQFETRFIEHTGLAYQESQTRDVEEAWRGIRALLDGGEPVLLKADVAYLPYYATRTEYNGHKVVVAGYDEEADQVWVADTHFEGLQVIGIADLKRTISSAGPPVYWPDCNWAALRRGEDERPLAEAIPRAIRRASLQMLSDDTGVGGLAALERFARLLPTWRELPDADWLARFGYQVIERRGSGGGLFRRLHARFLAEAAALVPIPQSWIARASGLADRWTELGGVLKQASEGDAAAWTRAGQVALEIAALEQELHTEVAG